MKKKIIIMIIILIVVFLFIICHCTANEEMGPKFIVTACNQEFLEDGVVVRHDNETYTYNDEGLVVYSVSYQDGSLYSQKTWEYDEFGNPVKVITEGNDMVEIAEYKNTLDKEGRILRQEIYRNGELLSVDEFTYDRKGNELTHEYTLFSENEEASDWRRYTKTYDWKGKLIQQTLHWNFNAEYIIWDYIDELCVRQTFYETSADKILEYWEKTYDRKGKLIRESRYDEAGNLNFYSECFWDETGRVQAKTNHDADGTLQNHSDIFTYDEYGNLVMQERCRDGKVYWKISYIYEQLKTT